MYEEEKKQIRKKIRRIQSHNGVDKNYLTSCDNRFTNYYIGEDHMMKPWDIIFTLKN